MSLRNKLLQAANQAALEATTNERARCLWCIESIVTELQRQLAGKLMTDVEIHAAQMKFKIARALSTQMRTAIVSGVRPMPSTPAGQPGPLEPGSGQAGAADVSNMIADRTGDILDHDENLRKLFGLKPIPGTRTSMADPFEEAEPDAR